MICGPPTNNFPKGLLFPRLAKVISRMVWHFRAWRKSFPEWFVISAHGESRFPKGLEFPRMAKVISRKVWSFRAWRKSFPERFWTFATRFKSFLKCISLYEWATWLKTQWMERQAFRYSLIACTNKMILLLNINYSNISNKPFIISNVFNMQRRRCYSVFRLRSTREIRRLR